MTAEGTDVASGFLIRKNTYYDSVFLMGVNKRLAKVGAIRQTAAVMGTESNKRLLRDIGVQGDAIDAARADDLIVAVVADSQELVDTALAGLDEALLDAGGGNRRASLRTLEDALLAAPAANLAVLSIPGPFIYREARKALQAGLNVFVFSSNVSLDEERDLKTMASTRGRLVMGPDCGTGILRGVGIGFANAVRRGRIGVVGPSGTGLQEFTALVHHAGHGISHAVGTGSRDLSDAIGGLTTFAALDLLEQDADTDVVAIIAKPPGHDTLRRLEERLARFPKPIVACFLGLPSPEPASVSLSTRAHTIDEAVALAVARLEGRPARAFQLTEAEQALAAEMRGAFSAKQKYVRGVFAGGTFCYQSQQILRERGLSVRSNAPLDPTGALANPDVSVQHTLVDMGDEAYTSGRPHPMIDATLRKRRIEAEGRDPETAVLLLDFILGYNASEDPVGDLVDAILDARRAAEAQGGRLPVVASLCGTEADPQDWAVQRRLLEEAGVVVFQTNARAALFTAELIGA